MVNIPPIYGDWDVSILDDDLAGILPLNRLRESAPCAASIFRPATAFQFCIGTKQDVPPENFPKSIQTAYLVLSLNTTKLKAACSACNGKDKAARPFCEDTKVGQGSCRGIGPSRPCRIHLKVQAGMEVTQSWWEFVTPPFLFEPSVSLT